MESISRFDAGRGTPQDWVLGIARYRGLSYLRAKYRNRVVCVVDGSARQFSDGREESHGDDAERAAVLRAAVLSLPETWQYVLRQKYDAGLSVVQIADLLDTSPKAVESTLSRARRRLRELCEATLRGGND